MKRLADEGGEETGVSGETPGDELQKAYGVCARDFTGEQTHSVSKASSIVKSVGLWVFVSKQVCSMTRLSISLSVLV